MNVGLTASVMTVVGERDTALALGSGEVPVLGTPRVVALVEEATVAAVRDALRPGETSVGTRVELEHLRASAVGATVEAHATVDAVDGARLEFAVRVTQDGREVARGRVTRQVVDRERFLARL